MGNVGLGVCPPENTEMDLIIAAFHGVSYLGEEMTENGVDAMISSWNGSAKYYPNLSKGRW